MNVSNWPRAFAGTQEGVGLCLFLDPAESALEVVQVMIDLIQLDTVVVDTVVVILKMFLFCWKFFDSEFNSS